MSDGTSAALARRIWEVGALCRAVADSLDARFNPVAVRGEVSGFSRASSGHCYFTLKDGAGQLRCAMFRRAAGLLGFTPQDGDVVEVQGRLGVYEARGDLQLIVETMSRAGQGALFEQFMRLKARLEAEGLFDPARKRELPLMPRGIGIVTSPGAAALHDVATCLRRRVPHIPVALSPSAVQGAGAARELASALQSLYRLADAGEIDVILLVRGGGSLEDLWSFNDEALARTIVQSPVPVVSGVGHETDFTIADFCADLRAPTPTAAAELAAQPRSNWLGVLDAMQDRLSRVAGRRVDMHWQRLDQASARLGRPSGRIAQQQIRLQHGAQRLRQAAAVRIERGMGRLQLDHTRRDGAWLQCLHAARQRLERLQLRLELTDPKRVLERGYALLTDDAGRPVTSARQVHAGQALRAALADGEVDLTVSPPSANRP